MCFLFPSLFLPPSPPLHTHANKSNIWNKCQTSHVILILIPPKNSVLHYVLRLHVESILCMNWSLSLTLGPCLRLLPLSPAWLASHLPWLLPQPGIFFPCHRLAAPPSSFRSHFRFHFLSDPSPTSCAPLSSVVALDFFFLQCLPLCAIYISSPYFFVSYPYLDSIIQFTGELARGVLRYTISSVSEPSCPILMTDMRQALGLYFPKMFSLLFLPLSILSSNPHTYLVNTTACWLSPYWCCHHWESQPFHVNP